MAAAVVYQQRGSNHYIYYSFHHLDRACHQLPLSSSEAIELAACCLSTNGGGASHRRSTQTAATKGSGCSSKRKHKPSSPLSSQCCCYCSGSPEFHRVLQCSPYSLTCLAAPGVGSQRTMQVTKQQKRNSHTRISRATT